MPQQRIDFVVTYLKNEKARVRSFWNEKDARAFAKTVDATRIERTSIEILWEPEEDEPDSGKPQPVKSHPFDPDDYSTHLDPK